MCQLSMRSSRSPPPHHHHHPLRPIGPQQMLGAAELHTPPCICTATPFRPACARARGRGRRLPLAHRRRGAAPHRPAAHRHLDANGISWRGCALREVACACACTRVQVRSCGCTPRARVRVGYRGRVYQTRKSCAPGASAGGTGTTAAQLPPRRVPVPAAAQKRVALRGMALSFHPPPHAHAHAGPQARAAAPAQSPLRKSNSRRRDRAGVLWMNHRPGMVHLIYMNIQGGSAFACNSPCTAPTVTGYIATALASTVSYLPFTASNTALDLPGITNIAICILDMLVAQGGCIMCNPPAIRTTVAMGAAPRLGARLV